MTQNKENEVIEGNRLISEFTGWRFEEIENGLIEAWFESDLRWRDSKDFLETLFTSDHGFCFNSSWNKLMPAIKKMRDYLQNMERPSRNHCCKGDLIEVDVQCHL